MTLQERLQVVRARTTMSQRDLAAASGVNRSIISKLEAGIVDNPTLFTLASLARVFGLEVGELLYGVTVDPPEDKES